MCSQSPLYRLGFDLDICTVIWIAKAPYNFRNCHRPSAVKGSETPLHLQMRMSKNRTELLLLMWTQLLDFHCTQQTPGFLKHADCVIEP